MLSLLTDEQQVLLTAYWSLVRSEPVIHGESLPSKYIEALSHLSRAAGLHVPKPRGRRRYRGPSNGSRKIVVTKPKSGQLA